jgi:hypothetical protein
MAMEEAIKAPLVTFGLLLGSRQVACTDKLQSPARGGCCGGSTVHVAFPELQGYQPQHAKQRRLAMNHDLTH